MQIMDRSLLCQGPPPSRFSCRTTMVMKPIRSKYDASTGLLIARMDHYCIWLNCTIGFKNHRLFMSFLISQLFTCSLFCAFIILALQRELQGRCGIAENLLGAHYLFPSVLLSASIVLAISLAILTYDQINNILRNQTVNEKVNYTRYPWMVDETGSFNNRFDRGWILNLLEFLQIPGYSVDYMCIFDIPGKIELKLFFELLVGNSVVITSLFILDQGLRMMEPEQLQGIPLHYRRLQLAEPFPTRLLLRHHTTRTIITTCLHL